MTKGETYKNAYCNIFLLVSQFLFKAFIFQYVQCIKDNVNVSLNLSDLISKNTDLAHQILAVKTKTFCNIPDVNTPITSKLHSNCINDNMI